MNGVVVRRSIAAATTALCALGVTVSATARAAPPQPGSWGDPLPGECEGLGPVVFLHHTPGASFWIGETHYLIVSVAGDGSFGTKAGLVPTLTCWAPTKANPTVTAQVVAIP